MKLLSPAERRSSAYIVLLLLVVSSMEIITLLLISLFAKTLTDVDIQGYIYQKTGISLGLETDTFFMLIVSAVGVFYILKNLLESYALYYQSHAVENMHLNFHKKLLMQYSEMSYAYFLTKNSSGGFSAMSGDSEQVFTYGMIALASAISEIFMIFFLVATVLFLYPQSFLILGAVSLVFFFISKRYILPLFYRIGKQMQEAHMGGNRNLIQFFQSFKEMIISGKSAFFIRGFCDESSKRLLSRAKYTFFNSLPRLFMETLFVVVFCAVVSSLYFQYENIGALMPILAVYLYLGFRIMPGMNRLIAGLNTFKATEPYIGHIYNEYMGALSHKETYEDIPDFSFNKELALKDVQYAYAEGSKNILKGTSFTIKKGDCIGIVGETGAGKSTILNILTGILSQTKGKVLVDNKYSVQVKQWKEKIGYVSQTVYLIDGTIKENIALGLEEKDVDLDLLRDVIEKAQISKLIDSLPDKENTQIGENGIRLSGGEKQRISIARALYKKPEVLIFDEATSALDVKTEERMMQTIYDVSKSLTVIMVAHRLTTLNKCNKIISLKDGVVEKITSYSELTGM